MKVFKGFRAGGTSVAHVSVARPAVVVLALLMALGAGARARAQDSAPRHRAAPQARVAHMRPAERVAGRVLTVHRHASRFASGPRYVERDDYAPGVFREWNDPNLDSFGGWRLGGDNFYGDGRGDSITRGNAALGAISGYGGARGGYGGPHFDSVGGFHNGPGPDAREDADYASGSVSKPDYGGIVPRYPSVKARVAALNTGVVPSASARFTRASLNTSAVSRTPTPVDDDQPSPFARGEDIFPDLDIDGF